MSLEIEGLQHRYERADEALVLDIAHFVVADAEECLLVGRSGGGKTTLLNIIAGIIRPSAGRVLHGGVDIAAMGEAARDRFRARHIGYVFQTFNLLQGLTALENVMIAQRFAGAVSRPRAIELLDRVGLSHRRDARPAKLSVGEQQRVAIARALANRPKLVLADEPTANLDIENGGAVLALLREVAREEKSSLLVCSHDSVVREAFDHPRSLDEISR